ncbi:MAG: TIGR03936 family radical SAM-associated protein [Clostridia bacterium]
MEKLRVIYSKSKEAIYLSHLDIMRVFEQSLARANVLVEHSKGYNPRPELVFAHPLSVGIESTAEIVDIMLVERLQTSYFIKEMNKALPSGLTVLSAEYVSISEKNIMSRVYAATYLIRFIYDENIFLGKSKRQIDDIKKWYMDKMNEYLDKPYLLVLKKSKGRSERIDIKPQIIVNDFTLDGNLEVTVSAGSRSNLKPDYIMLGFNEFIESDLKYNVKRTKILYN